MEECYEPGKSYFCYMVRCSDGTLYTGYTDDVKKRLAAHNSGKGAKYTRARRPCELVFSEEFSDKHSAMSREYEIKHKLTRAAKEKLCLEWENRGRE